MVLNRPSNFEELMEFVFALIRYKRYISNFSILTDIYLDIIASEIFIWNDECELNFQFIEESLSDLFD